MIIDILKFFVGVTNTGNRLSKVGTEERLPHSQRLFLYLSYVGKQTLHRNTFEHISDIQRIILQSHYLFAAINNEKSSSKLSLACTKNDILCVQILSHFWCLPCILAFLKCDDGFVRRNICKMQ